MFERLRQGVVESYVGAIALGRQSAQSPVHFANTFTASVRPDLTTLPPGFSLQAAVPELIRSVSLPLVWYILPRWLYCKTVKRKQTNQHRIQSKGPNKWCRRLTPVTAALSRLLL